MAQIGREVLGPYFEGDSLAGFLAAIAEDAFDFPVPLVPLDDVQTGVDVLELFHGPTAAFKDFGARFVAECLERLCEQYSTRVTIVVATSGDTGAAVAAACHRRSWCDVFVLFPQGGVSPRQEQQLTCWDANIRSFAVRGTFDDCQRLAKSALADEAIGAIRQLSSANSINVGRLLPQLVYYAAASLAVYRRCGRGASFIIPSGNVGNATACAWARAMGLPIERIVLAHNANRTVPEFFSTGEWRARASVRTIASAMDVGDPSNMERLLALFPSLQDLRESLGAVSVDDAAIRSRIGLDFDAYGRIWCPHSAVAAEVYASLPSRLKRDHHWVIMATAHPAKFPEIIEPLLKKEVPTPPSLAGLVSRPSRCEALLPQTRSLRAALMDVPN
jgi:threonine synthase